MASYESIPDDLRNIIENLPEVNINDTLRNSFAELWRAMLQIAEGDAEQAHPQFEAFLNNLPRQHILDRVDGETAHLDNLHGLYGGRKRRSRKNKKSSKKKRRSRKNKKSIKRRR
jgi:hypothetical protein